MQILFYRVCVYYRVTKRRDRTANGIAKGFGLFVVKTRALSSAELSTSGAQFCRCVA